MSTREQIILVRKSTNVAPHKQRVSNNSRWYRDPVQEQLDQAELTELVRLARKQRIAQGGV
jgi:hypothetical protein